MTQQTRAVNKARFEQGDTPQGTDYVDLIDSYLSLADTTAQAMSSPLAVTGALGATTVSAATVSANAVNASAATFTILSIGTANVSKVSAATAVFGTVSADTVQTSAAHATLISGANVSANALGITGSLTWTAEVTATTVSTGTQTLPAIAAGYLVATVCGQTVGIPYFKVS